MTAIALWRIFRVLASTECHFGLFGQFESQWLKLRTGMGTIAHGLFLGTPTGTPGVFAGHEGDYTGSPTRDNLFIHSLNLAKTSFLNRNLSSIYPIGK